MSSKFLNRAFNKLNAEVEKVRQNADPEAGKRVQEKDAEQALREESAPMTAGDAIQRIILAWKDKDYFRLLGMPPVEVDALGNPSWDCTNNDVSRAYRKLSVLVHPDKNPGAEAREAFDYLNQSHRILKDAGKLADEKLRQLAAAKERRAAAEARATVSERVVINAQRAKEAQELRKHEEESVRSSIVQQMRERQAAAKRKRASRQRARAYSDDDEAAGARSNSDDDSKQKAARASDSEDDLERSLRRKQNGQGRRRTAI